MCSRFQTLPQRGGLLDQDKLLMHVFQNIVVWKNQREELDKANASAKAKTKVPTM
jgi:hypothetical protein